MAQQNRKRISVARIATLPGVTDKLSRHTYELAVCGACMLEDGLYEQLCAGNNALQTRDFTQVYCVYLWEAFDRISARSEGIDRLTVCDEMLKLDDYDKHIAMTRDDLLERLINTIAQACNVDNAHVYSRYIREAAFRMRMVATARDMERYALDTTADIDDALDRANSAWYDATEQTTSDKDPSAVTAMADYMDTLGAIMRGEIQTSVPTGFNNIDENLGGLRLGEIHMLVGNSGEGKSQFAMSMIRAMLKHAATTGDKLGVLHFSYEMTGAAVMMNLLAMDTGVYRSRMMTGNLDDHHWKNTQEASAGFSDYASNYMILDDPHKNSIQYAIRETRRLQVRHPIKVVVFDGLWLMRDADVSDNEDGFKHYPGIMRRLKKMVNDLNVAVLILHQFSGGNIATDEMPQMARIDGKRYAYADCQHIWALKRYKKDKTRPTELYQLKGRGHNDMSEPYYFDYLPTHSMYYPHSNGENRVENINF
jgi:replicative DNA helicase